MKRSIIKRFLFVVEQHETLNAMHSELKGEIIKFATLSELMKAL